MLRSEEFIQGSVGDLGSVSRRARVRAFPKVSCACGEGASLHNPVRKVRQDPRTGAASEHDPPPDPAALYCNVHNAFYRRGARTCAVDPGMGLAAMRRWAPVKADVAAVQADHFPDPERGGREQPDKRRERRLAQRLGDGGQRRDLAPPGQAPMKSWLLVGAPAIIPSRSGQGKHSQSGSVRGRVTPCSLPPTDLPGEFTH